MNNYTVGIAAEEAAARYLIGCGMSILERNYRTGKLEVDIVAQQENELVFVEVKKRTTTSGADPVARVDERKQQRLVEAASNYIHEKDIDAECRFDILAINSEEEIEHIKGAFNPTW